MGARRPVRSAVDLTDDHVRTALRFELANRVGVNLPTKYLHLESSLPRAFYAGRTGRRLQRVSRWPAARNAARCDTSPMLAITGYSHRAPTLRSPPEAVSHLAGSEIPLPLIFFLHILIALTFPLLKGL
jgi:hypothetical protein